MRAHASLKSMSKTVMTAGVIVYCMVESWKVGLLLMQNWAIGVLSCHHVR